MWCAVALFLALAGQSDNYIYTPTEINIQLASVAEVNIKIDLPEAETAKTVNFLCSEEKVVTMIANNQTVLSNSNISTKSYEIILIATALGGSGVSVVTESVSTLSHKSEHLFFPVSVYLFENMLSVSRIFGWLYCCFWSSLFYPQLIQNYIKKSVNGLRFEFLIFTCLMYILYSCFNLSLGWSAATQEEFALRHPGCVNTVHAADVVFSVHALIVAVVMLVQSYLYEKERLVISQIPGAIVFLSALLISIGAVLADFDFILWLDVSYIGAYITMACCVINYSSQVWLNYKRQSTDRVHPLVNNVFGVVFDLVGGILCLTQMVLDGVNYGDLKIGFGNPSKFGLGFFSIIFNIVFICQYCGVFRRPETTRTEENDTPSENNLDKILESYVVIDPIKNRSFVDVEAVGIEVHTENTSERILESYVVIDPNENRASVNVENVGVEVHAENTPDDSDEPEVIDFFTLINNANNVENCIHDGKMEYSDDAVVPEMVEVHETVQDDWDESEDIDVFTLINNANDVKNCIRDGKMEYSDDAVVPEMVEVYETEQDDWDEHEDSDNFSWSSDTCDMENCIHDGEMEYNDDAVIPEMVEVHEIVQGTEDESFDNITNSYIENHFEQIELAAITANTIAFATDLDNNDSGEQVEEIQLSTIGEQIEKVGFDDDKPI